MSKTLLVVNGDLEPTDSGTGTLIQGTQKCSQDIAQALLSEYDSVRDIGGRLNQMVPPSLGGRGIVSSEVSRIVTRLIKAQENDPNLDPSEAIIQTSVTTQSVKSNLNNQGIRFDLQVRTIEGTLNLANTVVSKQTPTSLKHTWPDGVHPLQ